MVFWEVKKKNLAGEKKTTTFWGGADEKKLGGKVQVYMSA